MILGVDTIEIRLFAGLAEAAGRRSLRLEGNPMPATAGELERSVRALWPMLAERPFRVAINRRYALAATAVAATDEVALIPPVSGG